ncbi:MAG: HAD family hydrolase [Candidatus Thorarchaeota archaeon]|jgi:phosphoglycolate phosphatase-like HAD superfamily hydrolase
MEEKISCQAVIFDFDGTLADSMPFLERIGVQIMIEFFDVSKEDATQRYRSTTGLPYEHQIKMNFPDNPMNEQAIEEFEKLKIERIFEQELFPDAEETVRRLSKMGIEVFVSSSTFQTTIEEYFRRKEILNLFKTIVGYRPGFEKGADHFNHINSTYNVSFEDMVFVGDSLKDYERAQGFCNFIGVVGMFSEQSFWKAGHKGHLISKLSEIPDLVDYSFSPL